MDGVALNGEDMVDWIIKKSETDPQGTYTQQIVWVPPKGSGFIVQRVELSDPLKLLSGYSKPYYEAWKVEDGVVLHEGEGPVSYDDSFSNCWDGESIGPQIAIDSTQRKLRDKNAEQGKIVYNCLVFWVPRGSLAFDEVAKWPRADKIGITMAGKLRASYDAPARIGVGKPRLFEAVFEKNGSINEY